MIHDESVHHINTFIKIRWVKIIDKVISVNSLFIVSSSNLFNRENDVSICSWKMVVCLTFFFLFFTVQGGLALLASRRNSRDSIKSVASNSSLFSNEDVGPLAFQSSARGRQRRTSNFLELPGKILISSWLIQLTSIKPFGSLTAIWSGHFNRQQSPISYSLTHPLSISLSKFNLIRK